jgi:hypothetical protein
MIDISISTAKPERLENLGSYSFSGRSGLSVAVIEAELTLASPTETPTKTPTKPDTEPVTPSKPEEPPYEPNEPRPARTCPTREPGTLPVCGV